MSQAAWVRANLTGAQSQLHAHLHGGDYTMKRCDKPEVLPALLSNCPALVNGLGGPVAGEAAVDSHVLLRSISLWLTHTVRTVWKSCRCRKLSLPRLPRLPCPARTHSLPRLVCLRSLQRVLRVTLPCPPRRCPFVQAPLNSGVELHLHSRLLSLLFRCMLF